MAVSIDFGRFVTEKEAIKRVEAWMNKPITREEYAEWSEYSPYLRFEDLTCRGDFLEDNINIVGIDYGKNNDGYARIWTEPDL